MTFWRIAGLGEVDHIEEIDKIKDMIDEVYGNRWFTKDNVHVNLLQGGQL